MSMRGPLHGMSVQEMARMLGPVPSAERRHRAAERGRKKFQTVVRTKILEPRREKRALARGRLAMLRQHLLRTPQVRNVQLKTLIKKANELRNKGDRAHKKYTNQVVRILRGSNRTTYMNSILKNIETHRDRYAAEGINTANKQGIWNSWRGILAGSKPMSPPKVPGTLSRPNTAPSSSSGRRTPFPTIRTSTNRNKFLRSVRKNM